MSDAPKWKPVTVVSRTVLDARPGRLEIEWALSEDATERWSECFLRGNQGSLTGYAFKSGARPLTIEEGRVRWDTYPRTLAEANDHVRRLIASANEHFPLFSTVADRAAEREAEEARRNDERRLEVQAELDRLPR